MCFLEFGWLVPVRHGRMPVRHEANPNSNLMVSWFGFLKYPSVDKPLHYPSSAFPRFFFDVWAFACEQGSLGTRCAGPALKRASAAAAV